MVKGDIRIRFHPISSVSDSNPSLSSIPGSSELHPGTWGQVSPSRRLLLRASWQLSLSMKHLLRVPRSLYADTKFLTLFRFDIHNKKCFIFIIHVFWSMKYIICYTFYFSFWPCKYVLPNWNVSNYWFSTGNEFSHHINITNEFSIKHMPFYGSNECVCARVPFSSRKATVARFVVTWQIMSNHELIKFKRFISY